MEEKAQFGIGFVSGRPNVCAVINNTYKHLLNQTKKIDREVELTIFILYDLSYQKESREEDFYKIDQRVSIYRIGKVSDNNVIDKLKYLFY